MADKFDFAFVLNQNLNLKWFPVSQASVTFKVTGADDPLTLQRMRDAVFPEFRDTQKNINEFIRSRDGQISRLSLNARGRKEDVQLVDGGNKVIQKFLDEFKKEADDKLDAFVRLEAKKAEQIAAAPGKAMTTLKWVISLAWTTTQGVKAAADVFGAEGPLKILDGIKGFVDALKDVYGLLCFVRDQFADEKSVRAKVKAGFKQLQSQKTFGESDVTAVAGLVALYEAKVLSMENSAKNLSAKISQAISDVPKTGITSEARKEAEDRLDTQLQALVKLATTLKQVDKQLTTFKMNLGVAKATAKKEQPTGWLVWLAAKGYDLKDVAFDAWELKFAQAAQGLSEKVIDALIKKWSVPENVVSAY
jgi:hypothetical protein